MEETVQAPRGELPRREAMQTPEEVAAMLRLKALGGVSDGRTALAIARSETAASQFDTKIIEGFELCAGVARQRNRLERAAEALGGGSQRFRRGAWRPSPQAARCDCRARRYGARCLGNGGTARCTSASRGRTPAADGDVLRSGRLDGARRAPRSGSSRSVERMAQCCRGSLIIDPGSNSLCLPRVNLTMPRELAA
jgi:hypothetical protein